MKLFHFLQLSRHENLLVILSLHSTHFFRVQCSLLAEKISHEKAIETQLALNVQRYAEKIHEIKRRWIFFLPISLFFDSV